MDEDDLYQTTPEDALERVAGVLSPAALQEAMENRAVLKPMYTAYEAIVATKAFRQAIHDDTPLPHRLEALKLFQKAAGVEEDVPMNPTAQRPLITIILPGQEQVQLSTAKQTIDAPATEIPESA